MGARNIAAVFAYCSTLPHAPFRLLTYMALTSLDEGRPPRFWGGREAMAECLGHPVPSEPRAGDSSPEAAAARQARLAAFKAVKRALQTLTAAGIVECAEPGRVGRNSEYHLHLKPVGIPVDNLPEGDAHSTPEGDAQRPSRGTLSVHRGGRSASPRGTSQEPVGTGTGRNHLLPVPHQAREASP